VETTKYLVEKIASITTLEDTPRIYSRGGNPTHRGRPVIALWYDFTLWYAARFGQEEIVRWALDKGADHNITMWCHTFSFGSAFEEAAKNGYFRIASLLLARGAQIPKSDPIHRLRAFRRAVREGWIDVARIFLDRGFELQRRGHWAPQGPRKGDFLLFCAVRRGQVDIVKLLLERGAANSGISTAIGGEIHGYAVSHGYTSIVELLLEYKLPGTETA
jgi:ankyrin repeat protein